VWRPDQLTDKMSDSNESFDILRDIKPYSYKPLAKKVTYSINCDELTAASEFCIMIVTWLKYFLLIGQLSLQ